MSDELNTNINATEDGGLGASASITTDLGGTSGVADPINSSNVDTPPVATSSPDGVPPASGNTIPPATVPVTWQTFDPTGLQDETLKTVFTDLKTNYETALPLVELIEQRGGREFVESDLSLMDSAWAEDPAVRRQFHENFYQQSPEAYDRFMGDILADDNVKINVLNELGLDPQLINIYRQVAPDGTLNGQAVNTGTPNIDPAVYDNIRPELRDVFKALPAKVQEDWALSEPDILNWNLERAAIAQAQEKAIQAQFQRQDQERQAQQELAATQRQEKAYQDIRGIIKQSIAKALPGDEQAQDLILSSTETTLFDTPEGKALWMELAGLLQRGEIKAAQQKIPGMVAKAQVIATQKVQYLASVFEKARKYDQSQQAINTRREPGNSNGQFNLNTNTGQPEAAGQYKPENIMAYWNAAQGN